VAATAGWHGVSMATESPSDQPPGRGKTQSLSPTAQGAASERAFGLRIARDGSWWHEGRPIGRIALARLFATVLRREADGSYWLVTPVERGRIEVEDVPFVAVELAATGAGREQRVRLRTNLDEWVTVGEEHPLRLRRIASGAGDQALVPYVEVRPGLEARLARPVYYQLVELGEERREGGRTRFGVWSGGRFFALDEAD
jgi:uncharacterized protein